MIRDTLIRKFNSGLNESYSVKYCKNGTVLYRCNECQLFYSNRTKVEKKERHLTEQKYFRYTLFTFACPHCGATMTNGYTLN